MGTTFELNAPDRRSLRLHRAIVEKLRSNPQLFERVRARIDDWTAQGHGRSDYPYRLEWQQAIHAGMAAAIELALDESERGQVLRTCTPLTGVLSEEERQGAVRQAWRNN
jgi:hypothetical protein